MNRSVELRVRSSKQSLLVEELQSAKLAAPSWPTRPLLDMQRCARCQKLRHCDLQWEVPQLAQTPANVLEELLSQKALSLERRTALRLSRQVADGKTLPLMLAGRQQGRLQLTCCQEPKVRQPPSVRAS